MKKNEITEKIKECFKNEKDQTAVDRYIHQIQQPLVKDTDINRVEIIVLKYKQPEVEKMCVDMLIENTDHPYKLTFWDNRPNSANMSKIWNKLVKEATCEYVVIMDSDAFVDKGWLTPLVQCFIDNPDCGMAVPVVGHSSATNVQKKDKDVNARPFEVRHDLSGFCFMLKKSVYKQIGGFDENFYVFGQDSEYCERISQRGFKKYVVPASYVEHGFCIDRKNNLWDFSQSTHKARDDNEFNWSIDTRWASHYLQYLFTDYYPRQK